MGLLIYMSFPYKHRYAQTLQGEVGFWGWEVPHFLYLHNISKLSEHGVSVSGLGLVLPGHLQPMLCQALQLHSELLKAETTSAPGKSVPACVMETFASTRLFTPPEGVS